MSAPERHGNSVTAADISGLTAELAEAHAHAEALAARDTDLDTAGLAPDERRAALNAMRDELDDARDHLQRVSDQLAAAFNAQLAATKAALTPLAERAAALNNAVEAISLYLGSDEQIHLLRDGEPAERDTPITIYQDVLFMDEEMALAAEAAGIADATIDPGPHGWSDFDAWLCADERHVRQVCPAPRGIVALRSARERRRHHDTNPLAGDGSEITHFLVVNGEQLAWVLASTEFNPGDRLVPARNEIEAHFEDRFRRDAHGQPEKLTPGTAEWDRASAAADATQKHYLKIALILQGIVDRTTLLSPLPAETISFTTVDAYDDGHIVVVSTDGHQLPSGILDYRAWRQKICSELAVGQRVVFGHISHVVLHGDRDHNPGLHPSRADGPERGVPYEVRRREGERWVVVYPRTDEIWRTDLPVEGRPGYVTCGYAPARGSASFRFYADDTFVLPIDHPLVTRETLEWYLTSRENRRHFSHMVPLLRSALRALNAEAALEAPFRELVTRAVLDSSTGLDPERAATLVDDAVTWYKTKNRRHRALLADGSDDTAYAAVLGAVQRRIAAEALGDDPAVLSHITEQSPDAIYVGRRPDGTYIAITAADDRDVYVHVDTYSAKQGRRRRSAEWVTMPETRLNKEIRRDDRFTAWPRAVDTDIELTGPEADELVALLRERHPDALAVTSYRFWSADTGSATGYQVHTPGKATVVDPAAPLTGTNTPGTISVTTHRWKRINGTITLVDTRLIDHPESVTAAEHPYGDVIWSDPRALEAAWAQRWEPWVEHRRRVDELGAVVAPVSDALRAGWEQRAIEAEWAKFVAKYGTEATGRWDARKKTIAAKLSYPHTHTVAPSLRRGAELDLLAASRTYRDLHDALTAVGDSTHIVDDELLAELAELELHPDGGRGAEAAAE